MQKLQPLMPDRVQRWQHTLAVSTSRVRALLERHIRHGVGKELGGVNSKLLLSLPPEKQARKTFNLGTVVYDLIDKTSETGSLSVGDRPLCQ